MQLKRHKWIVLLFVLLMCSTIQSQFLDDNDFSYYNPDMNFNMDSNNNNDVNDDDIDDAPIRNQHYFYGTLDKNLPNSLLFPYKDSPLAPEGDSVEPEKGTPDAKMSTQNSDTANEKCAEGEAANTNTTTSSTSEECTSESGEKKAPLNFLLKALMPSSFKPVGTTVASTTEAPDSTNCTETENATPAPAPETGPTTTSGSPTEATTTAAPTPAAPTPAAPTAASTTTTPEPTTTTTHPVKGSAKGSSTETLPIAASSSGSTGDESKAKELQQLVQHLYIAQARVQLEATEIRKAQGVANSAQQQLEEAANRVRTIIATLQSAQQEVASAAIRAQTAQLQLAAHDQLLFAARQDVDALSSQMVGLQAVEGFVQPKTTIDVAGLLERLKKPLSDAEKPTAVPSILPTPKIKNRRSLSRTSLHPYYN